LQQGKIALAFGAEFEIITALGFKGERAGELIASLGEYAQEFYLKGRTKENLTETVHSYKEYLPKFFPIVHPSPLNIRWLKKNPWFEEEVVPTLKEMVTKIMKR